jgi:general secretion pathway protein H
MTDVRTSESGFTLLEMACVLAIVAILAAILLPRVPTETSRQRLEAYAVEAVSLLKSDRTNAMRRRIAVTTEIDIPSRSIISGSTARTVRLPEDVQFSAILPERCNNKPAYATISFMPTGMSCGGVLGLTRSGEGYEIRVNWLTGGIEVVTRQASSSRRS